MHEDSDSSSPVTQEPNRHCVWVAVVPVNLIHSEGESLVHHDTATFKRKKEKSHVMNQDDFRGRR